MLGAERCDRRKSTQATSYNSLTAIKFNSKTIVGKGNQLEYYMKPSSKSIQRKKTASKLDKK
jgi:hypothetical protein